MYINVKILQLLHTKLVLFDSIFMWTNLQWVHRTNTEQWGYDLHKRCTTGVTISNGFCKFKLYFFYKDYASSYTTYTNHACWHRCLRSDGLLVGGNRSARRKPTCLTWWPHDHLTCRRRTSNKSRTLKKYKKNTHKDLEVQCV